jgi:hypothetical protein
VIQRVITLRRDHGGGWWWTTDTRPAEGFGGPFWTVTGYSATLVGAWWTAMRAGNPTRT